MNATIIPFERDVLAHLDAQIESAQRLLGSILGQGASIRERDVEGVRASRASARTCWFAPAPSLACPPRRSRSRR